jgi:nucleotide-binding universal stress UspA family protein
VFNKLIVPLDGSELSASIVPHAACMARMMNAEVVLVCVGELPHGHSAAKFRTIHAELRVSVPLTQRDALKAQFPIYKDQEISSRENELLDALAPAEAYFRRAEVKVRSRIALGRPTEEILKIVEEEKAGAIMMSTHGNRGIDREPLGDTTKRIVRLARVPVIVVHPTAPKPPNIDMLLG